MNRTYINLGKYRIFPEQLDQDTYGAFLTRSADSSFRHSHFVCGSYSKDPIVAMVSVAIDLVLKNKKRRAHHADSKRLF
jgi:hypothetical protein